MEDAMTQTLTFSAVSLINVFNAVGGVVAVRVSRVARALKNRRDAQILAGLDDRMLKDIGLTRSDVRDAYAEPLWRDPTSVLVERAGERRAHGRRRAFGLTAQVTAAPPLVPENGFRAPATDRPARYAV
jgi:uncharacterized protein YjiS (DUF1127 family)